MKLSQSNFNLRSPDCYLVRSYLIATVRLYNPDNIDHSVSSDNVNGPASVACQSLIIHHDECCGENSKHSDEDEDASDEDDEESPFFQDSILDMYR